MTNSNPDTITLDSLPTVAEAAGWLTQIGTTPDGYIIIGPQGWHKLQEALGREATAHIRVAAASSIGTPVTP